MPEHNGSPPPVAVTEFTLGLAAAAVTVTGTVMTILPTAAPAAIEQPFKELLPEMT